VLSRFAPIAVACVVAAAAGCLGIDRKPALRAGPPSITKLTLVGQFSIPPLRRYPTDNDLQFGGISGLAMSPNGRDLLGISDAQRGGRVYRFRIDGLGGSLVVTPTDVTVLEGLPAETIADHEAIVALPNGEYLVASEGTNREPRRPPSIDEYDPHGIYVRRLALRDRFAPEQSGPATRGARGNAGFESLTVSPDLQRLFTATETALIQDGPPATFEAGTRTRILEYAAHGGSYRPAREFAYDLEPVDKPPFKSSFFINGLVELLAVSRTTLLALERGFTEDEKKTAAINWIRLYRITLTGATDISALDSLKGHGEVVPAAKTLLLDLVTVPGLNPDLAPSLDNFEGMTFGPRLPDGRASLILVSDDNFQASQRTWFLVFAIE
jgi:3-phytase/alkaline phosphatase D